MVEDILLLYRAWIIWSHQLNVITVCIIHFYVIIFTRYWSSIYLEYSLFINIQFSFCICTFVFNSFYLVYIKRAATNFYVPILRKDIYTPLDKLEDVKECFPCRCKTITHLKLGLQEMGSMKFVWSFLQNHSSHNIQIKIWNPERIKD